jgi:hypothetical protein
MNNPGAAEPQPKERQETANTANGPEGESVALTDDSGGE